ncbi:14.7 kDa ribonuclease H-like protein [Macadamia integrifolia]|uniref:14.7 kDa ribonuclease H-like protein n=1 Tax=Macadamia integrifolia TaxID=60698 RepID=UPI001C4FF056|nr:14.7 kDa ribonuclease H-like protein [Macadamia integrifolia]
MEEVRRRGPSKRDRIKSHLDSERCLKLNIAVPRRKIKRVRVTFWLPPMDSWWKLNCDGSSLGNQGNAGVGGLIRDNKCQIVSIYNSFLGIASNFQAEFQALIEGIERAREMNCASLWIECDLGTMVLMVQRGLVPWFVWQRWSSLISYLRGIRWKITKANPVADFLAQMAAKKEASSSVVAWPPGVLEFLAEDAMGRSRF